MSNFLFSIVSKLFNEFVNNKRYLAACTLLSGTGCAYSIYLLVSQNMTWQAVFLNAISMFVLGICVQAIVNNKLIDFSNLNSNSRQLIKEMYAQGGSVTITHDNRESALYLTKRYKECFYSSYNENLEFIIGAYKINMNGKLMNYLKQHEELLDKVE